MIDLKAWRREWNTRHKELRKLVNSGKNHARALELFYLQHTPLHSSKLNPRSGFSWEDLLLDDLPDDIFRRIPQGQEHSIAWTIWHLTRIEDIAMNLLAAGTPQLFHKDSWDRKLGIEIIDSGNEMTHEEVFALSAQVDSQALRDYRLAVGLRTQEIVSGLTASDLKSPVDPGRLAKVTEQSALREAASGIRDYWGKRAIGSLLCMPPTRHAMTHLNEAMGLKMRKK